MRSTILALAVLAASAAVAADDPPSGIMLRAVGHGAILADAKGMTLYTFATDQKGGASTCQETCAETWPPLPAPAGAKADGVWGTIPRGEGGALQWTFRGKPLYTYSRDVSPGDMNGDDLLQKWSVTVRPIVTPPGFGINKTPLGHLLVDQRRMTLYTSASDKPGRSSCEGACAKTWRPVEAWWMATASAPDWTVVAREDGTKQWAFKGKPLYRFAGDFNPGEAAGNGQDGRSAMVLEPAPGNPPWVTRQKSDGGELLADANGLTLYAHDLSRPKPFIIGFARDMERPELWKPVLAEPDAKPIGNWSIITNADGTRQWAHKGQPLYTHLRDKGPGDLGGIRSIDRVWRPIMTSGQSMPGTGT